LDVTPDEFLDILVKEDLHGKGPPEGRTFRLGLRLRSLEELQYEIPESTYESGLEPAIGKIFLGCAAVIMMPFELQGLECRFRVSTQVRPPYYGVNGPPPDSPKPIGQVEFNSVEGLGIWIQASPEQARDIRQHIRASSVLDEMNAYLGITFEKIWNNASGHRMADFDVIDLMLRSYRP
jgi:hypothetical protein